MYVPGIKCFMNLMTSDLLNKFTANMQLLLVTTYVSINYVSKHISFFFIIIPNAEAEDNSITCTWSHYTMPLTSTPCMPNTLVFSLPQTPMNTYYHDKA